MLMTQRPAQRISVMPPLRESLSTQTLEQMLGWLKDGTFRPGGKLPSQNELVEQFGVSRTGIREALQMMAVLNLIEIRPGLGCFVKGISPEYVIHADVLAILLEKEAILQVVETRKIVESGIASLAAERATSEDFWFMEDTLANIQKAVDRSESVARVAPEFHYAVAKASHNAVLAKMVRSFIHLMAKAGELLETSVEDVQGFKQNEFTSHESLYKVIRSRDPELARSAMIDHISISQRHIISAFEQAEGLDSSPAVTAGR